MKPIVNDPNISNAVMEQVYRLERRSFWSSLLSKITLLFVGVGLIIYLIQIGWRSLTNEGETAIFEMIIADTDLMRDYLFSEVLYLFRVFDEKIILGVLLLLLIVTGIAIYSWKRRLYLANKWQALRRLKSRSNFN